MFLRTSVRLKAGKEDYRCLDPLRKKIMVSGYQKGMHGHIKYSGRRRMKGVYDLTTENLSKTIMLIVLQNDGL